MRLTRLSTLALTVLLAGCSTGGYFGRPLQSRDASHLQDLSCGADERALHEAERFLAESGTIAPPTRPALIHLIPPAYFCINDLSHPKWHVRIKAAYKIGIHKERRGYRGLILLLRDKNEDVRRQAAESLGWLGMPEAIDALSNTSFYDVSKRVRIAALKALQELQALGPDSK